LLFDNVELLAYYLACLIWIGGFWRPEKTAVPAPLNPEALQEARKWEEELKKFIADGKR